MTAVDQTAILDGVELYGELGSALNERTLEILERRRRTAKVRRRGWLVRRALVSADLLGLAAALAVPAAIWGVGGSESNELGDIGEYVLFVLALPFWVVVAKLYGLYDRDEERTDHSTADDVAGVFQLVTVLSWLLYAALHLTPLAHPIFAKILVFWAVAVVAIPLCRGLVRTYCRRRIEYLQNAVIVGAGDVGQAVARKLLQRPEYGINLVGFVDAQPKEPAPGLQHVALLGDPAKLPALVRVFDIERVIFAFSNESHEQTLELIRDLKDLDVQIDIVPRLFELMAPGVGIHTVEGLPLVGLPPLRLARSSRLLKRILDLTLAVPALVVLAPFFGLVALAIKLDSRGPIFFRQERMGAGDRTFRIVKFRSMAADADSIKATVAHLNQHLAPGGDPRMFKIPEDPRITRVGRWLRRTSMDELPQLLNVVRGEMSLVGPRPLILDEDRFVEDWARQRLDVKPGMTGLWQVSGRSDIPFNEMIRLDYIYVTGWTLAKDIQLILRTMPLLLGTARTANRSL